MKNQDKFKEQLNIKDFVNLVQKHTPGYITKDEVHRTLKGYELALKECMECGQPVHLHGFGDYSYSIRSSRKMRNPKTGEEVEVKKTLMPKFVFSKKFRRELKWNK